MLYKCVMRPFPAALVIVGALLASIGCAGAAVVINVDKSSQRMSVEVDGEPRYEFAVSTGRAGYGTPNGTYHPQRLEREWFSKEYYDSPMPYSIFFSRGYAIHGSYEIRHLGGPASHGCIRLHPSNAAKLFALVQKEGMGEIRPATARWRKRRGGPGCRATRRREPGGAIIAPMPVPVAGLIPIPPRATGSAARSGIRRRRHRPHIGSQAGRHGRACPGHPRPSGTRIVDARHQAGHDGSEWLAHVEYCAKASVPARARWSVLTLTSATLPRSTSRWARSSASRILAGSSTKSP
jgi:hypothetical protein